MEKHTDIINDRIVGIVNDLKSYIDIRKDQRQHGDGPDNLGGGNIVMAIALFSSLGLLSKSYVSVASNERGEFDKLFINNGHAIDEQKIFVEFVEFLGADIGLFAANSQSKTSYRKVWERFRDFTTHVLVPDQGNIVLTYVWESKQPDPVNHVLDIIKNNQDTVFESNAGSWSVNVDKLLSLLPAITETTINYLRDHSEVCNKNCVDVLQIILWR